MWDNVKFTEDEQDNSKGTVSMDWVVVDLVLYSFSQHIDTTKAGIKTAFKTKANADKDAFLAKKTKQDNISAIIKTYMNA